MLPVCFLIFIYKYLVIVELPVLTFRRALKTNVFRHDHDVLQVHRRIIFKTEPGRKRAVDI